MSLEDKKTMREIQIEAVLKQHFMLMIPLFQLTQVHDSKNNAVIEMAIRGLKIEAEKLNKLVQEMEI